MATKEVEIPEGVNVSYKGTLLDVTGPNGNIQKEFRSTLADIKISDKKVVISSSNDRRKSKAMVGTWVAHTRNMIASAENMWEAKLRIVYSHFPMKVNHDEQKGQVVISNFLGERSTRRAKTKGKVKVEIKGNDIIITGMNREEVGQTAANIEQVARVRGYDKRIFQDGCHLVQKTKLVEKGE
ncbi:MAG: 50S ribosomal protein L6 [Nanoarchaeota archaeon]|nr:50S ribosomal protein L6 [Nanoarchaeota archaeon]MBU1135787.1 50S ribosomal protein L6 [Nanoarchaeota archaeon]MBU2519649.1 50S ribosomal protein L6 [Nanoarchaeota archaeon]